MKKLISVLLSVLLLFSALQIGSAVAFAEGTDATAQQTVGETSDTDLPDTGAGVSDYIPFEYACDYCGQTHEGFIGILITMLHTFMSAVNLAIEAVKR